MAFQVVDTIDGLIQFVENDTPIGTNNNKDEIQSNDNNSLKKIALWSIPRSVSTAFVQSVSQLPNSYAMDEPYGHAFYWGAERQSDRYVHEPVKPDLTYQHATQDILNLADQHQDKDVFFFKDFGYQIENHFESIISQLSSNGFEHVFLVRNPQKCVQSLYKMSQKKDNGGWGEYDPQESIKGYQCLWELYEYMCNLTTIKRPMVILSEELVSNPQRVMQDFCEYYGLEFSPSMLSWDKNYSNPSTSLWSGWHSTLRSSSGFIAEKRKPKEEIQFPQLVYDTIEQCEEFYSNIMVGMAQ